MELALGAIALVVALAAVAVVTRERRSAARSSEVVSRATLAPGTTGAADWGLTDVVSQLAPDLGAGDSLVYSYGRPGEVLIFGDHAAASALGRVVEHVPRDLVRVAVGVDAATRMATAAGEQAGMLVRLTEESTRKFNELKHLKEAGGATLGVFRNGQGRFAHVARFTSAQGLDVAANAAGALQGVALQAQLASIERAIGEVSDRVADMQGWLDAAREADERATAAVIVEVYDAARATGSLTPAMWDQIASVGHAAHRHHEWARVEMERAIYDLQQLASDRVKDRRSELHDLVGGGVERLFDRLHTSRRTLTQFQALRLWYLLEHGDRSAITYQEFLREGIRANAQLLSGIVTALEHGIAQAGEKSRFETILSPIDARRVQEHASALIGRLEEVVPSHGAPVVPPPAPELMEQSADVQRST